MKKFYFLLSLILVYFTINAQTWTQVGQTIYGQNEEDYIGLENEVAINTDGSIIAVASDKHNNYTGQVRVFQYDGTTWTQLGSDIDGEASSDNFGTCIALSADGHILAVGAPNNGGNGTHSGEVKIYQYNESTSEWELLGSPIYGEGEENYCGLHISLSNDGYTVAVSSPYNDVAGENAGEVRVFHYDGNAWQQVGNTIYGENAGEKIGNLSLNGDGTILAIGSNFNSDYSGFVRVYKLVNDTWTMQGSEITGEAAQDYSSIIALSDDGLTLAIGAYGNDNNGDAAGCVRVFYFDGATWTQIGQDINGDAEGDWFGGAVDISDDGSRVAVGAFRNNTGGEWAGQAKVFQLIDDDWQQIGEPITGSNDNDGLGQSIAISGNGQRIIVGIPRSDGNGNNSGAAQVYESPITQTQSTVQNTIRVFPNPAKNIITISGIKDNATVELTDLTGKKIAEYKTNTFDISDYPSGVYMLKIYTTSKILVKKLIKK